MIPVVEHENTKYRIGFQYYTATRKVGKLRTVSTEKTVCRMYVMKSEWWPIFEASVVRHSTDAPNRNIARDAAFRKMLELFSTRELKAKLAAAYFGRKGKKR